MIDSNFLPKKVILFNSKVKKLLIGEIGLFSTPAVSSLIRSRKVLGERLGECQT